ncbi:MAG: MFS transporter [Beijerinckiaceae bacterium]|nr:MFS transporter [Beijerinckiaceae bacterium]
MTTAAEAPVYDDRSARANVLKLAAAQALAGANSTVIMTTGAIVGSIIGPAPQYATIPVTVFVIGTALGTFPAGWIAQARGRKAAFYVGTSCGFTGGLIGAVAIYAGSFALFCLATFIAGFYQAVAHTFRFAATDTASPAFRPKALSWVMAGGVFSGVLGPQMVNWTMDLWQPYLFMVSFFVQGLIAMACMAVLSTTNLPKPSAAATKAAGKGRPLREIAAQPKFITAALCAMVSYALMNLVMTSAPLAMRMCGHALTDANWGIQWHVVAMFLPSFWTGSLIQKFGAGRVVAAGLALTAIAAIVGLMGVTVWHFWIGLIFLGVGWNLGFIGASSMVVETHRPEERNRVQAFNDFLVFGTMAVASFSSGQILAYSGWDLVNWVAFPPIAVALAALVVSGALRRAPRLAR